jgi:mono/diheme cytochrome c family protein
MRIRSVFFLIFPVGAMALPVVAYPQQAPVTASSTTAAAPLGEVPFHFVPQKLTEADRRSVAMLYARTCSGCHGMSGEGAGNGLALYGSKDPLAAAVPMHFGRAEPPPLKTVMPAYGALGMLSQTEIAQLAAYVGSFRPPWP